MWEYFSDKTILITGGTGFLGTALVCRLVSQTRPKQIYLLCRGGKDRAIERWTENLPSSLAQTLTSCPFITYLDGNIKQPSLGLVNQDPPTHNLTHLIPVLEIIIHAASSINLVDPLPKLSPNIIGATERLAHIALACPRLQRFIYISTAYANSHLYNTSPTRSPDITIKETLYPVSSTPALTTWTQLQTTHTTPEYSPHTFPWPYAYAKHLSERVFLSIFTHSGLEKTHLLIIRPSIFGPAQQLPYRGYSVPLATPLTALAAMIAITPSIYFQAATRSRNPDAEVTADEVPVDVVVDRTLFHIAHGSSGFVHAVCGERGRYRFKDLWEEGMAARRIPWRLRLVWSDLDWHSPRLHSIARFYVLFGPSFRFGEERTERLWEGMREEERTGSGLVLFKDPGRGFELVSRRGEMRVCARAFAQFLGLPKWLL
ncbi:male sterility domain-containing protein [Aspergillus heteromorphus CBS 117.55]|uniref:Fatty acyl-CoA reductase n=1 Tax=Aspergillus heteromorphus CBS 117.55 TaxID=1448321 RepID=A0A317WPI6_9EURO|nr:male sterility domain-containing protein [Aspergillus heteromorphus CBS 117.55]PWY88366.1 male sterility domain-containing protein [Aspergillus heteromorphus CBS 117.55]